MELRNRIVLLAGLLMITGSNGNALFEDERTELAIPCPEDSVLVNGTCECDHSLCEEPPHCNEGPELSKNRTLIPGDCCPEYTCRLGVHESTPAETHMCAVGAVLSRDGICECIDPEKTLQNGACECDSTKCPLQEKCDDRSVLVRSYEKSKCCQQHTCITCPQDSYPSHSNDDEEVESTCVCYKCEEIQCKNGTVNVIKRGVGFPGICCDVYECNTNCTTDGGREYADGEYINENQTRSICKHGVIIHQEDNEKHIETCSYGDKLYENEQEWNVDECTKCTCVRGETKCISADSCNEENPTITFKPKCRPRPKCSRNCPGGYKLTKDGCATCRCKPYGAQDDFPELRKFMILGNLSESHVIMQLQSGIRWESLLRQYNMSYQDVLILLKNDHTKSPCTPMDIWNWVGVILLFIMCIGWAVVKIIRKTKWCKKVDDSCDKSSCNLLPGKS